MNKTNGKVCTIQYYITCSYVTTAKNLVSGNDSGVL